MKIFFCGIGGIGMSSIALYQKYIGNEVYGSDRSFDMGENKIIKNRLIKAGIKIFPQDASGVTSDINLIVISTAVENQIPDIQKALELNIPIQKRAQLLSNILHNHMGIAVAGTSGKTTITAMIGHILQTLGKDPLVINGGIFNNTYPNQERGNVLLSTGNICVIEADESDGTLELYNPNIAIVSNISLDHKPLSELIPLFKEFIFRAKDGVVLNADCPEIQKIQKPDNAIFFGIDHHADIMASKIIQSDQGTTFLVNNIPASLIVLGRHNIENALCAIATCQLLGIEISQSVQALKTFAGTHRRMEKIAVTGGITIYDDYAHNPMKIASAIDTFSFHSGRKCFIFQPHGFGPTRLMKDEYIQTFINHTSVQDIIILPEIYYAGGTVQQTISSKDLADELIKKHRSAFYVKNRLDAIPIIKKNLSHGDIILVMGGRDNSLSDFCMQIAKELQ